MTFKDRLMRRPSLNEDNPRDSIVLPRFTFEDDSDNRPLVSTERLFRQWQDEETHYQPGQQTIVVGAKEQDIIVSSDHVRPRSPKLTRCCRSPGTDRTTLATHSTGRRTGSGSLLFSSRSLHSFRPSRVLWSRQPCRRFPRTSVYRKASCANWL